MASGQALIEILSQENALLATLDLVSAAKMTDKKMQIASAFIAARTAISKDIAPIIDADRNRVESMIKNLERLVEENKSLLEAAIRAQGSLVDTVAKAALPVADPAPDSYRPPHGVRPDKKGSPMPMAIRVVA
jgi:hypothetical protein